MSLLEPRLAYKPFQYPWAYEAWLVQQKVHWLPEEVPLGDDVEDWKHALTDPERHLLTQIFRFFTQADIEVNDCYMQHYARVFRPPEIRMMLSAFSNMETVHVAAYSHLLDTLGLPEVEYEAFLKYAQMKAKHDYLQGFSVKNKYEIARTLAAFGAFTEGMQLFASFAILLSFPQRNKMKGMGQIITWSVRDETLHCNSMAKLFRTFVDENPKVLKPEMRLELRHIGETMVGHEDAFIDLAFEMGPIEGLTADDTKRYVRYITDRRLVQFGLDPIYRIDANPLPWLDDMLNAIEFSNLFEARATEYSKAGTTGTWSEAFAEMDANRPISAGAAGQGSEVEECESCQ
jgi:ribonucleoside-diphosphate reductase beta chain